MCILKPPLPAASRGKPVTVFDVNIAKGQKLPSSGGMIHQIVSAFNGGKAPCAKKYAN
jgi:hypothetical protein